MKKGFTLVELLAVIVILAIIALIAVPIVTNIINNTEKDSELMSAKMYIDAVDKTILSYNASNKLKNATCIVQGNGNLDCEGILVEVYVDNTIPIGGALTIENRKVTKVVNLKIENDTYSTNNSGDIVLNSTQKLCTLLSETSKTVGAKYLCSLDQDRIFYVLGENESDSSKIDLIMNMNYTDDTVPVTMAWCDQNGNNPEDNTCNHDNLNPLIEHMQEVFGDNVIVSLPTYNEIYSVSNTTKLQSTPWLYDHLNGTTHSTSNAYAYWLITSSDLHSNGAYVVDRDGNLLLGHVNSTNGSGLRPIITVSENDMN